MADRDRRSVAELARLAAGDIAELADRLQWLASMADAPPVGASDAGDDS